MKDLAARALDMAESAGGQYAEVRIEQRRLHVVSLENGTVEAIGYEQGRGLVQRFFVASEVPTLLPIRFHPTGLSASAA